MRSLALTGLLLVPTLAFAEGEGGIAQAVDPKTELGTRVDGALGADGAAKVIDRKPKPGNSEHECDARRAAAKRDLQRLKQMLPLADHQPVRESVPGYRDHVGRLHAHIQYVETWLPRSQSESDWDAVDATLDRAWTEANELTRFVRDWLAMDRAGAELDSTARDIARRSIVAVLQPAEARVRAYQEQPQRGTQLFRQLSASLVEQVQGLNDALNKLDGILREVATATHGGDRPREVTERIQGALRGLLRESLQVQTVMGALDAVE